jgi:5-methylthioribose kinase
LLALDIHNAAGYLAGQGWEWARSARIRPLGGGVSNTVLLVEGTAGRFVVKQALEKLRVAQDWRSRPERALREAAALAAVRTLLGPAQAPEVVFTDAANCVFAMTAAPETATDWKSLLLAGIIDTAAAGLAGRLLGALIDGSRRDASLQAAFGDQTVFDELRLDPYYRFTAARHPALQARFERLIERCRQNRRALVHGDFSPKNLLVAADALIAIDFEVAHYGDPAFDSAFLLNHLALKAIHLPQHAPALLGCAQAFWHGLTSLYGAGADAFFEDTREHLGGLMLARVDGKSPAEYLTASGQEQARRAALAIWSQKPSTMEDLWQLL